MSLVPNGADASFNHPYCTDPAYGTQLNSPLNSISPISTPEGSRFLCQITRNLLAKGVGMVMPIQFIYDL